jgi:hypothetical protein
MAFSGGSYDEVQRWLWNFLTSHAKQEHPRVEVRVDGGDEREGVSYAAYLTFDGREAPVVEFDYREVADRRGEFAWCRALAERTRQMVREHLLGAVTTGTR